MDSYPDLVKLMLLKWETIAIDLTPLVIPFEDNKQTISSSEWAKKLLNRADAFSHLASSGFLSYKIKVGLYPF